ncbi:1331_t:CDS:1, partial [Cetraspora pellucida]
MFKIKLKEIEENVVANVLANNLQYEKTIFNKLEQSNIVEFLEKSFSNNESSLEEDNPIKINKINVPTS